jgi:sterol desaturase/sphingolipid hydroxylase (fatty acid hydroxylase superfamily)
MIETLQKLRLLPPPCNELVPLLTTVCSFAAVSVFVTNGDLPAIWEGVIDRWTMSADDDDSSSWWTLDNIFVLGSFLIYMTMYWGYSLLIHVAEHAFPKTLSNFKIQPEAPIASWTEVGKMAPLVLFNQLVFGIPMLKALFAWLTKQQRGGDIDMLSVPSVPKFVWTMILHVLCTEVWFYSVHRLLHTTPFLYKHVHCVHHQYKAPSCLESVYVHPIEFVLNSFAVMVVGPAVSGAPMLVVYIWIGLVTFLQVHDHSGYWFPFLPRVLMHDYHHQQIQCCYGIIGLLDGVFGTEKDFQQFVKDHEHNSNPSKKSE